MQSSVTTIIPCYRCADTIGYAVESVARQTLRPAEVILVDDGSEDDTLATLHRLQQTYGSDWIKIIALEKNRGVSAARNAAWDIATQDYIAFLDADDVWHPEKIAIQYSWLVKHAHVVGAGHRYVIVDPYLFVPPKQAKESAREWTVALNRLLLSNPFVTPAVMLKREIPYRFDPTKRYCEDYFLWLQIVADGHQMVMLRDTLVDVYKRIGESGSSRNLWKMRSGDVNNYWRLYRAGKIDLIRMSGSIIFSFLKFILLLLVGPRRHYVVKRLIEGD